MPVLTPSGRRAISRLGALTRAAAVVSITTVAACSKTDAPAGPQIPREPPANPQLRRASFIADIDRLAGKVTITAPPAGRIDGPSLGLSGGSNAPDLSIVAGDVVQLVASNYQAGALGAVVPGKVRVTFDINVVNKLPGIELITPTFPTPPAGAEGVILFPFESATLTTPGGVSVGGDGTEVIVELPSRGQVDPSVDWNGTGISGSGAPHNFFNDAGCPAGATDCYRWEAFASPLAAGATSEARQVGFDVDPTVGRFRVRILVATDLRATAGTPVGSVVGSVTSPQRGALSGVTVNVSGGFSGTTDAAGSYTINGINIGPRSVSVSNLPAGCTAPSAQSITLSSGEIETVNFSVTCTVPSGTVGGTISSSQGGGIAGVSVVVTPNGGSALAAVNSNASGIYSVPNVPVGASGSGSIALSNLPANCTNPGPQSYSGLTDGGSVTVDITVVCAAAPQGYQYRATWGVISGGQVSLTLEIDMSTFNDPAINGAGADDIGSFQADIAYATGRLTFASCAAVSGSALSNTFCNGGTPGVVTAGSFGTSPGTGNVAIVRITFNVGAGAPQSVTTSSSISAADSFGGVNLIPRILKTEGTLSIP